MRYDDARPLRGTGSLLLELRLLWARLRPRRRGSPYGNLSALSDHQLRDIGLTREEAEAGRRRRTP